MKLEDFERKDVGENVEGAAAPAPAKIKKKKLKYKKGKFANTLLHVESKTLYVRKSHTVKEIDQNGAKILKQKQIWRVCDPQTQERANQILKEINDDIKLARSGKDLPLEQFNEIAQKFLEAVFSEAVFRDGKKVSGKIQIRIPKIIVKRLVEYFGDLEIGEITYQDILSYKENFLASPIKYKFAPDKPRSIRSVNYDLSILKQIFKFALQKRWLARSPFEDGKNPIDTSQENKRYKSWTKAEEKAALEFCKGGQYSHMKAVIICICDGGFRKNELLSLKWSEVDFENDLMLAKNYKGNQLRIRPVFLTKRMKAALLEWQKEQKRLKNISDHSLVIGYADVKKAWNYLRGKIGRSDLRLHDLRHVFATRLNENKVSINNISQLLGHSQISTTQIYLNPSFSDLRKDIETLEDLDQSDNFQK